MECAAPIEGQVLDTLTLACLLLPSQDYSTVLTNFPNAYAVGAAGRQGYFEILARVFVGGKLIAEYNARPSREHGFIQLNLDQVSMLYDKSITGMLVMEYKHPRDIPIDLYAAHVHRLSGSYVAYPTLSFMGDANGDWIYQQELDNALFWPGIALSDRASMDVAMLNPYSVSYGYQLSLFLPDGQRWQTGALRIRPLTVEYLKINDLFPGAIEIIRGSGGRCSLCITGQHRLLCYSLITDVDSGIITTLDHFHRYTTV